MPIFNPKQALALGAALAFIASGATSFAQGSPPATTAPDPVIQTAPAPGPQSDPAPAATQAPATTDAPPAATETAVTKLNEIGAPPAGKGQIVFFRPARFVGMAVSFSVREGDTGIGKLTNGTYFVHAADPGVKEYNISFEARDTLRLEVEEGETYYVIQSVAMGVLAARPNLTPSTEEAFQEKKLKVTTAKATDRK